MATKITIDPFTRLEGHLRIEVEVENGKVKDAWSTSPLFRGMEIVLKNRDPRDAWYLSQRICGVCPISHGHTSTFGLEDAFGVTPPDNARIIRNIIEGAQFVHSHILAFYHLHALDYVDVVSALSARPTEASLKKVQKKLKSFVESGQLGPFANAYWGHPAYKLSPEINLLAVAHYLEALEMQAKASQLLALFGGKFPHMMTAAPGGVTITPTSETLAKAFSMVKELQDWVTNVYIPDVLAVAPHYLDWAAIGTGHTNYLAWGVFEDDSHDPEKRLLPQGAVFDGKLELHKPSVNQVTEHITHSWYTDKSAPRNPAEGQTKPKYTGINPDDKYSWVKAPRLNGKPMEVGPLSRMLVAYLSGGEKAQSLINSTLEALGVGGKPEVLLSTLGRVAARALECKLIVDEMVDWTGELTENIKNDQTDLWYSYDLPDSAMGVGTWEAPRGALAHWNNIENGVLKNYQVVSPSTWNFSPRDDNGTRGPVEEALIGTPVENPEQPIEVMRVVHSFDP
ncbi:MAG: nickel-dependent hydrogenase large subunit [Fidelibacterota bacterium]